MLNERLIQTEMKKFKTSQEDSRKIRHVNYRNGKRISFIFREIDLKFQIHFDDFFPLLIRELK